MVSSDSSPDTSPDTPTLAHMEALISQWAMLADPRGVFLSCYCLMTRNVRVAIRRRDFHDPVWVDRLLEHFAGYYFAALDAYERDPGAAPKVWQLAHNAARDPAQTALQRLLLGVSAHINYDLVLTLVDLLDAEWTGLDADRRAARYADYCIVNTVIGQTIDAVQDQVLDRAMPSMALIDRLMGPLDELLVSRVITYWRETVWQHAATLLDTADANARARFVLAVEDHAVAIAYRLSPRSPQALDG